MDGKVMEGIPMIARFQVMLHVFVGSASVSEETEREPNAGKSP